MEFWSIVRIIFFLVLIVGLMYGTLFMMKKYFYTSDKTKSRLVRIKVLSTQMIMPKKFIQVVQVHDKVLVLGVSEQSINLLKEFEGFVPEDKLHEDEININAGFKENFVEILKKNLGVG
ncbi:MAG: flagellar biosynthetic protein FliO [Syntrophothermus sp.]